MALLEVAIRENENLPGGTDLDKNSFEPTP
jgi:hypothetical protein